ncbi:hypothetical protein ACS0TY_029522 [Phlomoides rotata]
MDKSHSFRFDFHTSKPVRQEARWSLRRHDAPSRDHLSLRSATTNAPPAFRLIVGRAALHPNALPSHRHLIRSQSSEITAILTLRFDAVAVILALNFTSLSGIAAYSTVAKDLSDPAMILAHVTLFYPKDLAKFPSELLQFLESAAHNPPSGLRVHVTQALILLANRQIIGIVETLVVFMELQTVGDRALKQLSFSHVTHTIRRMNQKHKNDPKNKALQYILFGMLQQEEEEKAKRALITLCDLHRRKVWLDDRTANVICMSCFHPSSRIMIVGLSFLLGFEKIEDDDTDDSGSEDNDATQQPHVVVNKEALYKVGLKAHPYYHISGIAADSSKFLKQTHTVTPEIDRGEAH